MMLKDENIEETDIKIKKETQRSPFLLEDINAQTIFYPLFFYDLSP
jgi:hypothetical protein